MRPKDFAIKEYKAPIEKISIIWTYLGIILGSVAIIGFRLYLVLSGNSPDDTESLIFYAIADIGAILSLFYAILNGRQLRIALIFGLIHDIFLGINAFRQAIFASFFYYFFISFPLLTIGFIRWNRNSTNTTQISTFSNKYYFYLFVIFITAYILLCGILNLPFFNAKLLYFDAFIIVLNCFATFFSSKRTFIQWPTYILHNILCLIEYSIMSSYDITNISLVIAMVIYVINSVINLFLWLYKMKKHNIFCREFYQN